MSTPIFYAGTPSPAFGLIISILGTNTACFVNLGSIITPKASPILI